ncbi:PAS domain-containing sensor histidine kinase [Natrialba swarupiae]|uniref:histidine kinase n=1 Tax=Natrialba swarupiae TaxID=2448032 RepID=A0A5D5ATF0_9EURY|nr:PAS domain S-box protein [Natrialba swarupiae]TYT62800.1 PAS domain S-box protein [Natrialba swarupiae]
MGSERREETLRELNQFREAIIQSANVWINTLDEEGNVTLWNRAAEEISGYPAADVVGDDDIWTRLYPDDDYREEILRSVEEILQGEKAVESFETTIETRDGAERIISWNSHAIVDSEGERQGSVAVGRDVTERRERERQLRRQNERLNEFSNIVSHDLRNPLTIAQGYLGLARTECDSDHLEDVDIALTRIDQIVNQTLALARHGRTIDKKESTDLAQLAEHCWETVDTARGELVIDDLPRTNADPRAVRHLFENLFRNTIEHGGDDVTVRVGPCEDGFYVEDDGVGLPADLADEIFEPVASGGGDSAGLGLAIVKRIVEAHGWRIRATESTSGGARFEIAGIDPIE